MKALLSLLLSAMFALSNFAMADSLKLEESQLAEAELEAEVEQMEFYGEDTAREQTKQAINDIEKETNALKKEIAKVNRQTVNTVKKKHRLQDRYNKSSATKVRVQKEANVAKAKLERRKKEVENLNNKVNRVEQAAIQAKNMKNEAVKEVARLDREKRQLLRRIKVAENVIKKQKRAYKKAVKAKRKVSATNKALKRKVARLEAKAGIESAPFESESTGPFSVSSR